MGLTSFSVLYYTYKHYKEVISLFCYDEYMKRLAKEEIKNRLSQVSGWRVEQGSLCKDFIFKDFTTAFSFMAEAAKEAEKINHHPDWSNSYNKVSIRLTTHSAGGLTDNDFSLARLANEAAQKLQRTTG